MEDEENKVDFLALLTEQLNRIKEEQKKENENKEIKKDEQLNKNDLNINLNDNNMNNHNIFFNNINNNIHNINESIAQNNEILYPKNEFDEDEQYKLALKLSEEEANKKLDIEKEEEKQFQLAIEESKKYNNEINTEEFDEDYGICPITQEYMENPVITPSGTYYEKKAIIDWINKNNTDPMTREILTVDMLIEDHEYKNKIIEYRKKFNK